MKATARTPITITRDAPGHYGVYCTVIVTDQGDYLSIDVNGLPRPRVALKEFWRAVRQHQIDYLRHDFEYRWHC